MSLLQSLKLPPLPQQGPAGETQGMPLPARVESRANRDSETTLVPC